MGPVYFLHHDGAPIGNAYATKTALIEAARTYLKNTGKTPTYTFNHSESPHHFTAEELAEPQAPAPREFKLGDVVKVKGIEGPKMVVRGGPTPSIKNGIATQEVKIPVFWFNASQDTIYDSFDPELLGHVD